MENMEYKVSTKILKITFQVFVYLLVTFGAILMLIPFLWMILTALKSTSDVDLQLFWPSEYMPWRWWEENFVAAMTLSGGVTFLTLFKNTILVGGLTTMGTLVTTVLAAYAFARIEFKGRNVIFMLFLATMMIPGEMMTITNYMTISRSNLTNTYTALILPFMVSVFYIFFLRQTVKQIPHQLYQAARVDGVGDFKFLVRVVIPISMPTLITITILGIIGTWNAYIWPNLVINKAEMRLISDGVRRSFSTGGAPDFGKQLAAATIVTIPLLFVFILLKKFIVKGVARSGIKG